VFLIPLSSVLSAKVLVVCLAVALWSMIFDKPRPFHLSYFWDVAVYILVVLIGLIYSSDIDAGLKVIETNFSFIALPIILSRVFRVNQNTDISQIFTSFFIGLFLAVLICLTHSFFRYQESGDIQVFFYEQLTGVINSHPTYLAYYLIFAITVGLFFLNYKKLPFHPVVAALSILFLFLVLILTSGQTAFVSLLLVFAFYILKFFLADRSNNRMLIIGSIVLMMFVMFFVSSTGQSNRAANLNDAWDRFGLWQAAIDANPNILFGVGTGDSKIVLNEYFRLHNLNDYADSSLNAHNQFIQSFLTNGLLGFFALVVMLTRPLYLSFRNGNPLGILVFFPFLIYGMTEVFLGRYQGIVFFSFLHLSFVAYYASSKPSFSLKGA
jgi:O-antigen ligase